MYQPHLFVDDAAVSIRYAGWAEQSELDGDAVFVRCFAWNHGLSTAEDCSVMVDKVWLNDQRISLFARSALSWTGKAGTERFAARKLLAGQANGVRVDGCKIDNVTQALQILSEASHAGTGYHWYTEQGVYTIDLIAQSSSFWATPARYSMSVQFEASETGLSLSVVGGRERRHLLRIL